MTHITQAESATRGSRGDFDRLARPLALFYATSSLLRGLLLSLASVQRKILASRREEEAFFRLNQLDEHQLRDIGLMRVEEIVGWQIAARGAAPTAIIRFSYQRLAGTENNGATASQGCTSAKPASI
jgi:uncharacterized protein YjiS (DUF1127 family)